MKKRGNEKRRNALDEKSPDKTMAGKTNHMARFLGYIGVDDLIDGDSSSFDDMKVGARFDEEVEGKSLFGYYLLLTDKLFFKNSKGIH